MKRISITKSKAIRVWETQSNENALSVLNALAFVNDIQKFAYGDSKALDTYGDIVKMLLNPKTSGGIRCVESCKIGERMTVAIHDSRCEQPKVGAALVVAVRIFDKNNNLLYGVRCGFEFESPQKPWLDFLGGKIDPMSP